MDNREKLIQMMKEKTDLLYKHKLIKKKSTYFSKADEKDILSWDLRTALQVRIRMAKCMSFAEHTPNHIYMGLGAFSCPFCLRYSKRLDITEFGYAIGCNCKKCTYGMRHGICGDPASDYTSIYAKHRKKKDISFHPASILTKEVYIEIWNRIKEM